MEIALAAGIGIALLACAAEYVDSTLGMGYGTTLTPLLLLLGFEPLEIVPAVLLSEFATGLIAGFTHHSMGNVNLKPRTLRLPVIIRKIRELGVAESYRRGMPRALTIALVIAAASAVGTVAAVFLALNLSKFALKVYIGVLVLLIGIVILATMRLTLPFSWARIVGLGLLASFNKGISGGGYGPVVTGGQILSGVEVKETIGITSLAEGLTCAVAVTVYAFHSGIDWTLAPYLAVGALLSVPLTGLTVRWVKPGVLRVAIGIITVVLGTFNLVNVLF